jgi:uncharacterized short protein YbdD (DUF466 family)
MDLPVPSSSFGDDPVAVPPIAGLSSEQSNLLFDFFVEHIAKANPTQAQVQYSEYIKQSQEKQPSSGS